MQPNPDDPRLTKNEQDAMKALIAQRDIYRSRNEGLAARGVGVAIWLCAQIFLRIPDHDERIEKQ